MLQNERLKNETKSFEKHKVVLNMPITSDEFKRDLKLQLNYDGYNNATIDTSKGIENLNIEI